jgi:hypothetical protein
LSDVKSLSGSCQVHLFRNDHKGMQMLNIHPCLIALSL